MLKCIVYLHLCRTVIFSELWLQWLQDEIKLVSDESDREKVDALFDKAVKDYLCKYYFCWSISRFLFTFLLLMMTKFVC